MNAPIIFVLGTGRSGTSLLTRILSLSGCALPDSVIPANFANPKGFWEPSEVVTLNEQLFHRCGSSWFDSTLVVQERLRSDDQLCEEHIASFAGFLSGAIKDTPMVIKDPRISETLRLWAAAAERAHLTSLVIIVTRTPNEFIRSAETNSAHLGITAPREYLTLLWLKRSLLATHHSRGLRRVVVDYKHLLNDWKLERQRISQTLDLPLSNASDPSIDSFVTPALYRQRDNDDPLDLFPYRWLLRTYRALSEAAMSNSVDQNTLDDIFAEFASCERTFRMSAVHTEFINSSIISSQRNEPAPSATPPAKLPNT